MTRLRGGSGSAPDPGRPTAVGDRGLHHPSKLPAGSPDVLTKNTIAVTDPARVLPWNKEKRQRDFNILVKRYKSQLLYGCQDPFCTTPTCFSYRKRASDVPLRRFTELSARTVACYLASQDNPERGLCRNIPAINTDFLSGDPTRQHRRRSCEASQQNVRFASDFQSSDNVEDNGTPKKPTAERMHQTESGDNGAVSKSGDENEKTDSPQSEGAKGPLRLKDPKSFTQNLFDTLSLRMVEWLPLRKSPEAFDTTQSDPSEDGNLPSKSPEKEAPPKIQDHPNNPKRNGRQKQISSQPSIKPRRQSIASSNPQPTAVEVKIPGQPVKRLSLGEMEHRKQPSKSFTEDRIRSERKPARKVSSQNTPSNQPSRALQSPPPLKHRPQRHSNANGDVSNPSKHEQRQHMRVSRDGSRGPRKLENSERDNNRVSIDYSMQHSQSATHPLEIPVCKNTHTGKQLKTQQIQTLSHLSKQLVTGLEKLMFENDENRNKWDEEMSELESRGYSEPWDWQYATPRQREVFPFVAQSVFYVLSSPRQLLQSFRKDPPTPLEVNNWENVIIVLLALATSIPLTDPRTWEVVRHVRSSGTVLPDAEMRKHSGSTRRSLVAISEKFEHDLALRLLNRLVRAVSARLAFHEISKTRTTNIHDIERQEKHDFTSLILQSLRDLSKPNEKSSHIPPPFLHEERPTNLHMVTVEWLRTLLLKEWDGKPEMAKSGAAGGALQLLASMYTDRSRLGLRPEDFHTALLSERLDPTEMPVEWLGILQNNKSVHLLSYPFLFPPSALVIYFRAINYANMSKSYEAAMTTSRHVTQPAFSSIIPIDDDVSLLARLKTSISTYLVLVVRRDNVLTDALDQLWRRERRELMRPLKVQMGMDEGEEGIDHGGVQQEFFRVAFGEALDPSYGMFTMDMRTRISWFQPCSMEPLYKFELLGLLTSLAVYNGLTLPVNFPVALYKKLLGLKVKTLDDIEVGWPELAKGLSDLLSWDDGDVGDIFMRTYEFSFEAFGNFVSVDMEKVDRTEPWPATERPTWERKKRGSYSRQSWSGKNSPRVALDDNISMLCECADESSTLKKDGTLSGILKGASSRTYKATRPPPQEAALVTNANRERFVKDYIFWLTDKSIRPQYEAFARGFYTCLDRTALSIFTPEALKTVIEGIQEINIEELEHHTRYEGGFEPGHRVIRDFWVIVKGYPQTRKRQLLEFVTASDRVPVNGISSIMFVIQRNGTGDSRLPTSLTCFGRLLLPDYSSRDILEEKLEKALENARGFGVA
ncbi:conserved hypothetical protein [Histoplasma mississippiense (nom. inval.)]|uniref:conserved hypothetical protein n=1 Tax=Ajellomyces capsulatus (strain NAm1 / WU24) TaxID=2059318 RepID=UPI000157CC15|nr:conserved hypothetical protein [Histoplasma mississippiense (nom. inval.)]EDN10065.1 conserved hypothetical protein [Histoplasma mississippiense (nom. inval.)]